MTNFKDALTAVKEAKTVLIFTHRSPDGDALGSMSAIGLALKNMGKSVDYLAAESKGSVRESIPEALNFVGTALEKYDLAVVVDSSSASYAYGFLENKSKCDKVLVIDHHATNEFYGDINVVKPNAAACCEIVYRLLQQLEVEITKDIAHSIYVGIATDTGNFVYSNTTAETHRITAELYEKYDDFFEIAEKLKTHSEETALTLKIGLNHCDFYRNGKAVISYLLIKDGYDPLWDAETDPLMDAVRYINGVEIAAFVKQTGENCFKVSMRSGSDDYDVSFFAKAQGGGGHAKAAGFDFVGKISDLTELIKEYFGVI